MAGEPENLTLRRVRELSDKLIRTNQKLEEMTWRVLSLERDLLSCMDHRLRQEIQIADIHAMLERIQRRLEISDGRD